MIASRSVLLKIRNISDKARTENQNTILCSIMFFSENRTVNEIMWKNMVERFIHCVSYVLSSTIMGCFDSSEQYVH